MLVFTTAACLGGGGGSTTTTTSANASANGPGCQFIVASEARRATVPIINQSVFLDNATANPTVCYDKITFTFQPGGDGDLPPAYTVQYVPTNAPGVREQRDGVADRGPRHPRGDHPPGVGDQRGEPHLQGQPAAGVRRPT